MEDNGPILETDLHVVAMLVLILPASILLWYKSGWFWPQLAFMVLIPQGRILVHMRDLKKYRRKPQTHYFLSTELAVAAAAVLYALLCS